MTSGTITDAVAAARAVARHLGMEFVEVGERVIATDVVARLPVEFQSAHLVLPLAFDAGVLQVAVADPIATDVLDRLPALAGARVDLVLATEADLRQALARIHATSSLPPIQPEAAPIEADADAPAIRFVRDLISEAAGRRASDIHLEPMESRFRVRLRIDGRLHEAGSPGKDLQAAVISRLKLMADISIAERRVPQDGRIRTVTGGRALDLRVSSLPTVHGESVVMRVLDSTQLARGLADLGLLADDQEWLERVLGSADGMVLVTGPTGSGKTTTLYAGLQQLNRADRKIITVEDPVEYQLAGINQVPVHGATGMTFATALRAMLRQAPNVIMVGEIRDLETAEVTVQASLTGHLVFSTLHTNDAPSAVMRLVDLGLKPYQVAAATRAVIAQRLVRRVCPDCRAPHRPAAHEWVALGLDPACTDTSACVRGGGCPACRGTGYRGRICLFERLTVDDDIRSLIYGDVTAHRLRQAGLAAGMRSLKDDGIRKVLAGLTTIEEVVSATTVAQP
jgi:type IV pilus assembly protein PilB